MIRFVSALLIASFILTIQGTEDVLEAQQDNADENHTRLHRNSLSRILRGGPSSFSRISRGRPASFSRILRSSPELSLEDLIDMDGGDNNGMVFEELSEPEDKRQSFSRISRGTGFARINKKWYDNDPFFIHERAPGFSRILKKDQHLSRILRAPGFSRIL